MTTQHKTGTHPFYIGMYIHIYMYIYILLRRNVYVFLCDTSVCFKFVSRTSQVLDYSALSSCLSRVWLAICHERFSLLRPCQAKTLGQNIQAGLKHGCATRQFKPQTFWVFSCLAASLTRIGIASPTCSLSWKVLKVFLQYQLYQFLCPLS